jgi:predicted kinase
MAKVMYIMRGLPGSGKSYFISMFKYPAVCSADHYFMVGNKYLFDRTALGDAHKMCKFKAQKACEAGIEAVYIDNTNTTWKEILPYVAIAEQYGYEVMFMSPNTAWANDVEECFKRNTHNVPKEIIQAMKDRWQDNNTIFHSMNTEFPNVKGSFI